MIISSLVCLAMLLMGAFSYVTSSGEQKNPESQKNNHVFNNRIESDILKLSYGYCSKLHYRYQLFFNIWQA